MRDFVVLIFLANCDFVRNSYAFSLFRLVCAFTLVLYCSKSIGMNPRSDFQLGEVFQRHVAFACTCVTFNKTITYLLIPSTKTDFRPLTSNPTLNQLLSCNIHRSWLYLAVSKNGRDSYNLRHYFHEQMTGINGNTYWLWS